MIQARSGFLEEGLSGVGVDQNRFTTRIGKASHTCVFPRQYFSVHFCGVPMVEHVLCDD